MFYFLFCFHDGQKEIDVRWTKLKIDLKRRTDVVGFITDTLIRSNQVKLKEVKQAKTIAAKLFWYVETSKTLNRSAVSITQSLNTRLSKALSRLRTILEQDQKLKNSAQVFNLLTPLEGIEGNVVKNGAFSGREKVGT